MTTKKKGGKPRVRLTELPPCSQLDARRLFRLDQYLAEKAAQFITQHVNFQLGSSTGAEPAPPGKLAEDEELLEIWRALVGEENLEARSSSPPFGGGANYEKSWYNTNNSTQQQPGCPQRRVVLKAPPRVGPRASGRSPKKSYYAPGVKRPAGNTVSSSSRDTDERVVAPGAARGPCNYFSSAPSNLRDNYHAATGSGPSASVEWSEVPPGQPLVHSAYGDGDLKRMIFSRKIPPRGSVRSRLLKSRPQTAGNSGWSTRPVTSSGGISAARPRANRPQTAVGAASSVFHDPNAPESYTAHRARGDAAQFPAEPSSPLPMLGDAPRSPDSAAVSFRAPASPTAVGAFLSSFAANAKEAHGALGKGAAPTAEEPSKTAVCPTTTAGNRDDKADIRRRSASREIPIDQIESVLPTLLTSVYSGAEEKLIRGKRSSIQLNGGAEEILLTPSHHSKELHYWHSGGEEAEDLDSPPSVGLPNRGAQSNSSSPRMMYAPPAAAARTGPHGSPYDIEDDLLSRKSGAEDSVGGAGSASSCLQSPHNFFESSPQLSAPNSFELLGATPSYGWQTSPSHASPVGHAAHREMLLQDNVEEGDPFGMVDDFFRGADDDVAAARDNPLANLVAAAIYEGAAERLCEGSKPGASTSSGNYQWTYQADYPRLSTSSRAVGVGGNVSRGRVMSTQAAHVDGIDSPLVPTARSRTMSAQLTSQRRSGASATSKHFPPANAVSARANSNTDGVCSSVLGMLANAGQQEAPGQQFLLEGEPIRSKERTMPEPSSPSDPEESFRVRIDDAVPYSPSTAVSSAAGAEEVHVEQNANQGPPTNSGENVNPVYCAAAQVEMGPAAEEHDAGDATDGAADAEQERTTEHPVGVRVNNLVFSDEVASGMLPESRTVVSARRVRPPLQRPFHPNNNIEMTSGKNVDSASNSKTRPTTALDPFNLEIQGARPISARDPPQCDEEPVISAVGGNGDVKPPCSATQRRPSKGAWRPFHSAFRKTRPAKTRPATAVPASSSVLVSANCNSSGATGARSDQVVIGGFSCVSTRVAVAEGEAGGAATSVDVKTAAFRSAKKIRPATAGIAGSKQKVPPIGRPEETFYNLPSTRQDSHNSSAGGARQCRFAAPPEPVQVACPRLFSGEEQAFLNGGTRPAQEDNLDHFARWQGVHGSRAAGGGRSFTVARRVKGPGRQCSPRRAQRSVSRENQRSRHPKAGALAKSQHQRSGSVGPLKTRAANLAEAEEPEELVIGARAGTSRSVSTAATSRPLTGRVRGKISEKAPRSVVHPGPPGDDRGDNQSAMAGTDANDLTTTAQGTNQVVVAKRLFSPGRNSNWVPTNKNVEQQWARRGENTSTATNSKDSSCASRKQKQMFGNAVRAGSAEDRSSPSRSDNNKQARTPRAHLRPRVPKAPKHKAGASHKAGGRRTQHGERFTVCPKLPTTLAARYQVLLEALPTKAPNARGVLETVMLRPNGRSDRTPSSHGYESRPSTRGYSLGPEFSDEFI